MDGGSTKFRLVRCPKCRKLLLEYADIPVYNCGGCGKSLRAKIRTAAGENHSSRSLKADHSESFSEISSSANGSASSVKQMFACSTSAHSSEVEHEEKETVLPNVHSPYSNAKRNHQEDGETSGEPDEGVHSKAEGEKSLKPSQQPPESVDHSVASEDDTVERGSADALDLRSSHAYDGSISSSDNVYDNHARDRFLRLSRRTHRPKALDAADNKGKEGEEVSESNQKRTDVEADVQVSSKLSRNGSGTMRTHELVRETSSESEDFHSVQNWMEPENGGSSGSPSRGSHFQHDSFSSKSSNYLGHGGMDLLRKMDELRNQLRGFCVQSIDGQQPLHQKPEHQPPQYFNPNLIHHPPEAIHGPRQITFRQYQFSQMPFSGQRCCSRLHRCPEEYRQVPMQTNHRTDGVCRAHAYSLHSHSPTAGSSGTPDHEQEKLRYNEKRKRKKNHCRPMARGAPFVICCNCFELLQLPAGFLISKRRLNKLQCAACSEVLELAFPAVAHISPRSPGKVVHPCNEVGNRTDVLPGSVSHSNDFPRGDPVSFSEVYGLSFTKSFSTEAEPVLHVSTKSSEGGTDKQKSGLPLHRLMGYSSASELLYQCWDIDEGYESIESMVPRSYRPSQESHAIDGLREKGMSTSCHQQIGPCTNPDCMEIHEEEESPQPLPTRRGYFAS